MPKTLWQFISYIRHYIDKVIRCAPSARQIVNPMLNEVTQLILWSAVPASPNILPLLAYWQTVIAWIIWVGLDAEMPVHCWMVENWVFLTVIGLGCNTERTPLIYMSFLLRRWSNKPGIKWAGLVAHMGGEELLVGFLWGNLKERGHLEDLDIDRKVMNVQVS